MEYLHTTIAINGVTLEVIGNYCPGEAASLSSPGESASLEITSVLTKGDDIGDLIAFSKELLSDVTSAAIEAHKDGRLCAQADAIADRREDRRNGGEK